jgi:DNA-binding CsgD family transcriptional regulator
VALLTPSEPSGARPAGSAGSSLDRIGATRHTGGMGHRVSSPDFVGRIEELDLLGEILDRARAGQAATVLVSGDAGIGKSRLVEEFGRRARRDGARVATGFCLPIAGGGLPYGPVVGILRDLAHQLGEAEAREVLGPLASGLTFSAPGGVPSAELYSGLAPVSDELAKTRLFESILVALMRLAEQSPTVLVFEDLQWADSGSADLVSFLTRNLASTPVLLVGTYRGDELGRDHPLRAWLTELSRSPRAAVVPVGGLDRDELTQLIAGILGHAPDWTLVEAVWSRSQGNAFFAEELTAARHSPRLSAELQGVIMSRVEGFSDDAQRVLQLAAAAGPSADHRLLVAAGDLEGDRLDGALAEAIDHQVLVVEPDQAGYRFRHALLREAVEDSLLPGERARLHRRLATAVTDDPSLVPAPGGHRAGELAAHWWAAGDWSAARSESLVAAEAAASAWAFPEALVHLERALEAMTRLGPDESGCSSDDRRARLEQAADVAYLAGANERSVELARAAIDLGDAERDPSGLARCYTLLSRNAWAVGDSESVFDAYRRAKALVPADPPSVELARILAEEARGLMLMSRHHEAMRRCRDAIEVAEAVGARAEEGHARCTLGCSMAELGRRDEGLVLVQEALAIAEEVQSPEDLNRAYANLSSLLMEVGRLEETVDLVFAQADVDEHLWGVRLNGAAGNCTEAMVRLGRFDDALELLAQLGDHALGVCSPAPYLLPAPIAIRRGRLDDADELLVVAGERTAGMADVQQRGTFHIHMAELALARGRPDEALEELDLALALAAGTDDETYRPEMFALGVRGLADELDQARTTGRRLDADKSRLLADGMVKAAEELAAAPVARGGKVLVRTEAHVCMARAEQSRLDRSDPRRWAEAADGWLAAGEPYPHAYCRWRQAEALLEGRRGRRDAADCLQRAWQLCVDMGALPLQAKIEQLARRARIPLAQVEVAEPATADLVAADLGLTRREVEVLGQLAAGRTDGEIAEALFISKKTASVHVSNLLRKLEVANRVQAGRIGQEQGLG